MEFILGLTVHFYLFFFDVNRTILCIPVGAGTLNKGMCSDMTDLPVLSTDRELDSRVSRAKLAPFTVLVITVKGP